MPRHGVVPFHGDGTAPPHGSGAAPWRCVRALLRFIAGVESNISTVAINCCSSVRRNHSRKIKVFVVLALVAAAAAVDVRSLPEALIPIVKSSYESNPEGFQYAYETGNGIVAQAGGVVKNPNSDNPELEVTGSYKYTAPDGTPVEFSYVANEQGYQPTGNLLPVPPPIPAAIQRSLEWIAAHPQAETAAKSQPNKPIGRF